ncbi:MAG: hypothetical protein AB8H86_19380 [Polyangiales bacterium]
MNTASETYDDIKGRGEFSLIAPGVVLARAQGHLLETHVSKFAARLDETPGTLRILVDLSELHSYESASRKLSTAWCTDNRARVESLQVLSRPGIVAMGVATATMALSMVGLKARAYSDENPFRQAVNDAKTAPAGSQEA